ncbi:NAD(P)-binding protein [Stipitochalara longipes BDJ]|nr:NAD(P)-binding protein [Stipitochalara longipes BDJ]
MAPLPTLRWGIIGTGWISTEVIKDLLIPREDAKATHIIQAIGCSSFKKGQSFARSVLPNLTPTIYGSYSECYNDPNVDLIYIGTPHAFHKQSCLEAIAAGKHILCEKSFTLNARDATEVFAAAKEHGVFVMEAMWTRFFPLTQALHRVLHEDKLVGDIVRVFADFGLDMDIKNLGPESRLRNKALGAGSLLDIGIYSLTWGLLCLDEGVGEKAEMPKVTSFQTLTDGVDTTSSILLFYPKTGRQGILTSTLSVKTDKVFVRVEGTKGTIFVEGQAASCPSRFRFVPKGKDQKEVVFGFDNPGAGFFYEADAVALDIRAERKENAIMPWSETIRVLDIMDGIRHENGALFPQDE